MSWTNKDGLVVKFGLELGDGYNHGSTSATPKRLAIDIDPTVKALPVAADIEGSFPMIPAGSYITRASVISETTFTAAGAATLDIGLAQLDGTVIDLNGIDAVIALAALTSQDVVACNGVLVDGVLTVGTADAYVYFTVGTGPYTAGKAKLVIEYIEA